MNRSAQLLLGISTTVSVTLFFSWIAVQGLIIRPAIGEREHSRIQQVLEAAALLREGVDKQQIEESRGIDLRLYHGEPDRPPPGTGWIQLGSDNEPLWKRDGGKYEIAAWTGRTWVVIHEHFPFAATLALALGAAGIPVIILMFAIRRQTDRHQEEAEKGLKRIAEGNLGERLNENAGNKETRRMAFAVNRTAEHLEALIESDRQRMAGLSHELRTPLTRIRLELELARREGGATRRLDRVERDIEAFDSMLAEMLELSRLQLVGEQQLCREVVDLAGLAEVLVDEEGWDNVEIQGAGTATVDATLAKRLMSNLLRNSAQHAPSAQRWVEVGEDRLSVGDDGPGMPVDLRNSALQPFKRGEASGGHGLGLAIVAQIAALHGGSVSLSTPPGLVVDVRFGACSTGDR